jgi:hypothetical protein
MANSDFLLTVDGETADVRSLMCHFQNEPYPGGRMYQLIIRDTDVLSTAKKEFGLGTHREPAGSRQTNFLSYLFPMIGMKCGRSDLRFWANTIAEINVSEDKVLMKGVCSPQNEVPASS